MLAQIKSWWNASVPPQFDITPTAAVKEQAWSESSIYNSRDFPKYNPDELLSRRGLGVYSRMMTDEQVKAVVRFKRDAITSRTWLFECDHDELSDEERAHRIRVFERAVSRMQGTFIDALNGIMSALYNGYSITEKLYQPIDVDGRAWLGIKALKLRPCDTFFFYVDEYGNVNSVKQQLNAKEQDIDIARFIHYAQNPDYDQHYGRSELRECYRAWFSKDMIIKFQNIHLERFAAGFVWAQPKEGRSIAAGSQEETNLRSALSNIQAKTSIILPSGIDLHIEHPATTDAFERAVAQQDKAIAKALLVPNLMGISEQGSTGSYAQSQTQLEAFLWTLEADATRLADVLNEQLFRELGDLNFGDSLYPTFTFKPVSNARQDAIIKTWQTLVTAGAVTATDTDEVHLREVMEFPKKGKPLVRGDAPAEKPVTEESPEEGEEGDALPEETIVGSVITISAFTRAMKRVDFAVIANKADNGIEDATHEIAIINSQAVARLVALAEELKLGTADGDPNDIQKIQYTASEMSALKGAVNKGLKDAWTIGESHARRELQKARFSRTEFGFDPDQPRDDDGKWTDGGGSVSLKGAMPSSASVVSGDKVNAVPTVHHTTAAAAESIKREGFRNASNAMYGPGVYFTDEEFLSDRAPVKLAVRLAAHNQIIVDEADVSNAYKAVTGKDQFGSSSAEMAAAGIGSMRVRMPEGHNYTVVFDPTVIQLLQSRMSNGSAESFAINDLALQDVATAYLKQKAYTLAGDISGATQKTIRNILMEGVKTSKKPSETRTAIYKALESDGLISEEAVQEALGTTTVKSTKARIDTAIRTTSFEAINEARYQFFSDPALDGFVEALEYSAILDDRTTEICNQLNGQTYAIDDEVWSTFRPPNHFNCRSILVPVTVRDTWSASDAPSALPQKGFGFNRCNHAH